MPLDPGRGPAPEAKRVLFRAPFDIDPYGGWGVTPDGERFLLLAPDARRREPSTTLIVDWPAMLEKR